MGLGCGGEEMNTKLRSSVRDGQKEKKKGTTTKHMEIAGTKANGHFCGMGKGAVALSKSLEG